MVLSSFSKFAKISVEIAPYFTNDEYYDIFAVQSMFTIDFFVVFPFII